MVAKPRASRRLIAELAFILRALLDEFEAARVRRVAGHRAALDLADQFARGADVSSEALAAAKAGIAAERARYGTSGAELYAKFCALPVDALLLMVEHGDDESTHVLTYARQCVPNASWSAGTKRVEELQRAATMHASAIDAAALGARKAPPREEVVLVDGLRAERDRSRCVDRATLLARLDELALPATESILAFEERFGGLVLPSYRIGVWAALNSGTTRAREPRLVPVALGDQDDIYFLDAAGAAHCFTLTDPPMAFGASGEELVTRLALAALTYASTEREGTVVSPPADRVAKLAEQAGLTRLYADAISEWWSGPSGAVVVIRDQVWGLARTPEAAAILSA